MIVPATSPSGVLAGRLRRFVPASCARPSLRRDFLLTLAAYGLIVLSKTVYFVVLARARGPRALGDVTTVVSVGTLISLVTAAGIGPAATRTLAASRAVRDPGALRAVFRRTLGLSTAALGTLGLAAVGFGAIDRDPWLGLNLALFTITYGLYQYYRSVDYGLGTVGRYLGSELVTNALVLATVPLLLAPRAFWLAPFWLGYTVFCALAHRRARLAIGTVAPTAPPRGGDAGRYAVVGFAGTLASMASLQLAVPLARAAVGHYGAGLLAAAFALLLPLLYLPRALATALLPRASAELALGDAGRAGHQLARLTLLLTAAALPLTMIGALAATPILTITSGQRYAPGADGLRLLLVAAFFMMISVPAVNLLSATNVADLVIPAVASAAGLVVSVAGWGASAGGASIDGIVAGVLAGTVVKSCAPVRIAYRRHGVALGPLVLPATCVVVAGVALTWSTAAPVLGAVALATLAVEARLLWPSRERLDARAG